MHTAGTSILARTLALTPLGRVYERASHGDAASDFSTRALAALGIAIDTPGPDLDRVPATGPLVVVANHPFGGVDGLALMSLIARVRKDIRLLGNGLLRHIPALRPDLFPIDVFGGSRAVKRNSVALRRALRWLDRGGCLLVFPAGEVAHRCDRHGATVDSPWQPAAADLAVRARAAVVPVYFAGCNSSLFRTAGRLHPLLRTMLLPREMWALRGRTISVRVGEPVLPDELGAVPDRRGRTELLRERVTTLSVTPRGRTEDLAADIEALQSELLLESGSYQVFCASAQRLPAVLPEIGRLRELAFRQAGEGTGLSRDLDRFDETYQHLFVWDRTQKEIAGAYRLGATDVVAAGARVDGLYTRTLFEYDRALLDEIGPALELGRSYVHPAYQRDFSPLLLLWKGISRFIARSGRYRRLFGVVSISDRYDSISRQLLVKFLQARRFDADLGRLVRAKNPPPPSRDRLVHTATVNSIEEVSAFIRRVERDGKDIPVLLRQYLKLNAKLLGFTVDRDFGNVLDGLVIVDLAHVEPAILSRYMGRAEAAAFLTRQCPTTPAGAVVRTHDRAESGVPAGLDAVAP